MHQNFPRALAAAALFAGALLSVLAWSQDPLPPTSAGSQIVNARVVARGFLHNGQPAPACALLEHVYGRQATQTDVLFMQATCSRELGHLDDAIAYYRRLIELAPQALRPRAELGAVYLRAGRPADARATFAAASQLEQEGESARLLSRLAQELAPIGQPAAIAAGRKPWRVDVFGGVVHDTNINGGPSSSTVAAVIGGVPLNLTLSADSRPKEATGLTANLNAQYLKPLSNNVALLAQGALAKTGYFEHAAYNNDSVAGALALIYRKDRFSASLQPNVNVYRQGGDTAETTYGTTLRLTQGLASGLRITGSTGFLHGSVPLNHSRDYGGELISAGLSKALTSQLEVGGEYLFQREHADAGIYSRVLRGPVVYALARPSEKVTVTASYRYSDSDYAERQAIFAQTRRDDQHIVGVSVDWNIGAWTMKGLRLRGQYNWIRNRSNIDAYAYDRKIATLGVAMAF